MPFTLPMVSKTAYLGIILSYRALETDTVNRRIQATQMCFHVLKKWLTAQAIPSMIRFRLYHQCIVPTLMYGIHEMGITAKGFRKTISTINVHFRRMVRSPVHLTHETTQAFFQRLNQTPPWILKKSHNCRLLQALAAKRQQAVDQAMANGDAPDVIVHTPAYPMSQLEGLTDTVPSSTQDPTLTRPECQRPFNQADLLERHMRIMHQIPYLPEDVFNALRDSHDGLSTYNHCRINFSNMIALTTHINKHVCPRFDRLQAMMTPIVARPDVCMPDRMFACIFDIVLLLASCWTRASVQSLRPDALFVMYRFMPKPCRAITVTAALICYDMHKCIKTSFMALPLLGQVVENAPCAASRPRVFRNISVV